MIPDNALLGSVSGSVSQSARQWAPLPMATFTSCFAVMNQFLGDPGEFLLKRLRSMNLPSEVILGIHFYVGERFVRCFIIKPDGEYVVLDDDVGMFPSDALVASIRLLLGAGGGR